MASWETWLMVGSSVVAALAAMVAAYFAARTVRDVGVAEKARRFEVVREKIVAVAEFAQRVLDHMPLAELRRARLELLNAIAVAGGGLPKCEALYEELKPARILELYGPALVEVAEAQNALSRAGRRLRREQAQSSREHPADQQETTGNDG